MGPSLSRVINPFNVIGLDPGGTTGVATASWVGEGDIRWSHTDFGPNLHHRNLYDYLYHRAQETSIDLTIVCEKFEFRQNYGREGNRNKVELISREYIGIVELIVAQFGAKLVMQSASQGKHFVTDAKLKLSGLLIEPPHPNRHKNDAIRHIVRHLVVDLGVRSPITDTWRM
jgi:hypothetical protein